eukprot:TRINITY_DN65753_c7_g1_i2.p1 TRINITY_DN65753_c7_g1~~TRINITY_DN65753_c7_g1_i2.p1  ORF type:complete len:530 (+),score=268.68 TRINITY_DN65753_c7_g1_i2:743-2332(+)
MVQLDELLEDDEPVHLLLVRTDGLGVVSVVAAHQLEWRKVIVHGRLAVQVELIGGENDLRVPVGMLDLDLEIVPLRIPTASVAATATATASDALKAELDVQEEEEEKKTKKEEEVTRLQGDDKNKENKLGSTPTFIPQESVVKLVNRQRDRVATIQRKFRAYAKVWWKEFAAIRPAHQQRHIKMFALNEYGVRRFVSTFVQPLRADRCLDSPLHAARFVRLIPYEKDVTIGGERTEIWYSPHSVLSQGKGDLESHALLLCSLLLGFGLDAYVVVGTNHNGPHMWVLTRRNQFTVMFWESISGRQYEVPVFRGQVAQPPPDFPFRSVHCCFNHKYFFANAQADDAVHLVRFNFEDTALWKAMNPDAISVLPRRHNITIKRPLVDGPREEERLEGELRTLIAEWRHKEHKLQGAPTLWDPQFSYILSSALSAYESERVTGHAFGNVLFQESVKRYIDVQSVFKAVPMQFSNRNATEIFAAMLNQESGTMLDLMRSRGDNMRFGLRVRVTAYAETVCSVWVVVAVKYRDHSK